MATTKTCSKCKKELDISNFCKNSAKKDGLNIYCYTCMHSMAKIQSDKRKNGIHIDIKGNAAPRQLTVDDWKLIDARTDAMNSMFVETSPDVQIKSQNDCDNEKAVSHHKVIRIAYKGTQPLKYLMPIKRKKLKDVQKIINIGYYNKYLEKKENKKRSFS